MKNGNKEGRDMKMIGVNGREKGTQDGAAMEMIGELHSGGRS